MSIGRAPDRAAAGQRPRLHGPSRARSGPRTRFEGAHLAHDVHIRRTWLIAPWARPGPAPGRRASAPLRRPAIAAGVVMVLMSLSRGALVSVRGLFAQQRGRHQRQGGILGAGLMAICPFSSRPPRTMIESMSRLVLVVVRLGGVVAFGGRRSGARLGPCAGPGWPSAPPSGGPRDP